MFLFSHDSGLKYSFSREKEKKIFLESSKKGTVSQSRMNESFFVLKRLHDGFYLIKQKKLRGREIICFKP